MVIIRISRNYITNDEDYTLITFKTWYGKKFSEVCITPKLNNNTYYAKNGKNIPKSFWLVVKCFLRTDDENHAY